MELHSCRLCMGDNFLTNLYEIDEDIRLDTKITFCINVELHPKDGFPVMICKQCKRKVQKFYQFKQMCLKVDQDLRATTQVLLAEAETHFNQKYVNIEATYDNGRGKNDNMVPHILPTAGPRPHPEWQEGSDHTPHTQALSVLEDFNDHGSSNKIISDLFKDSFTLYTPEYDFTELDLEENQSKCKSENYQVFNELFNESIGRDIRDIHDKRQCDQCGAICETNAEFKQHRRVHCKNKIHQCKFCPKWFTRAENRAIHMQSHLGIKPFVCEICGQTSTKKQDLQRHMKVHSDEKNHECQSCGRRFKRSSDLCSHIRTHTGARPYGCKHCGKTYTSHSGLRKHVKTHRT